MKIDYVKACEVARDHGACSIVDIIENFLKAKKLKAARSAIISRSIWISDHINAFVREKVCSEKTARKFVRLYTETRSEHCLRLIRSFKCDMVDYSRAYGNVCYMVFEYKNKAYYVDLWIRGTDGSDEHGGKPNLIQVYVGLEPNTSNLRSDFWLKDKEVEIASNPNKLKKRAIKLIEQQKKWRYQ